MISGALRRLYSAFPFLQRSGENEEQEEEQI